MERTYTVSRILEDTPCITITGKWLRKFGIELGSKIKLIEDGERFILMKVPDEVWKREKQEKRMEELKSEMEQLENEMKTLSEVAE